MSSINGYHRDPDQRRAESCSSSVPVTTAQAQDCQMATLVNNEANAAIAGMPSMRPIPDLVSLSFQSCSIAQGLQPTPMPMAASTPPPSLDLSPFDIAPALAIAQWTLRQTYAGFEPPGAFLAAAMNDHDLPVVFASDGFVEMAGYARDEILGRNCRFLQAPPGSCAEDHINTSLIQELKAKIGSGLVSQHVIPNFKKDGDMFINFMTIIPVLSDICGSRNLIFSFSVDITNTGTDSLELRPAEDSLSWRRRVLMAELESRASCSNSTGQPPATCCMVYNDSFDGSCVCQATPSIPTTTIPASTSQETSHEQPFSELSNSTSSSTVSSVSDQPIGVSHWPLPQDLHKLAFDQISGLILVTNLRGQIHYVSSLACTIELGYDPNDIVGQLLQDMCHTAESGLITRRIASASAAAPAHHEGDILFRLRHHNGSHVWYSWSTKLFKHAKRRFVIFSGWVQPVPSLSRRLVVSTSGGFGDRDLWLRITSSGLVLGLLSPVPTVLALSESDIVATTFQDRIEDIEADDFRKMLADSRSNMAMSGTFKLKTPMSYNLQADITIYPYSSPSGRTTPFSVILHCRPTKAVRGNHTSAAAAAAATASSSQMETSPTAIPTSISTASLVGTGRCKDEDYNGVDHNDEKPTKSPPAATTTTATNTIKPTHEINKSKPLVNRWAPPARIFARLDPPRTTPNTNNTNDGDEDHDNDDDDIIKHKNGSASTDTCRTALSELYSIQAENMALRAELQQLEDFARHRKRLKSRNHEFRGCANCHARVSPEWRRGPSGVRDLCNRCGLRWAKLNGGRGGCAITCGSSAAIVASSVLQKNRIGPPGNTQVRSASGRRGDKNVGRTGKGEGRAVQVGSEEGVTRTISGKRLRDEKDGGDVVKNRCSKLPRSLPVKKN